MTDANRKNYDPDQEHIELYEQNINKGFFDGVYLQENFNYPAVIMMTERDPSKIVFRMFNNTTNLKKGDSTLYYLTRNKKLIALGKVDYNIDIVYAIEQIFRNYRPRVAYLGERGSEPVEVDSKDLLGTIRL